MRVGILDLRGLVDIVRQVAILEQVERLLRMTAGQHDQQVR